MPNLALEIVNYNKAADADAHINIKGFMAGIGFSWMFAMIST